MLIVVGLRAETGVRGFEKKRPGRHLPWRRIPLPTWRNLLTR